MQLASPEVVSNRRSTLKKSSTNDHIERYSPAMSQGGQYEQIQSNQRDRQQEQQLSLIKERQSHEQGMTVMLLLARDVFAVILKLESELEMQKIELARRRDFSI